MESLLVQMCWTVPEGMRLDICSPRKHGGGCHGNSSTVPLKACVFSSSSRRFRTAGMVLRRGWGWKASTRCIRRCSVCCLWPRSETLSLTVIKHSKTSLSRLYLQCIIKVFIVMHCIHNCNHALVVCCGLMHYPF